MDFCRTKQWQIAGFGVSGVLVTFLWYFTPLNLWATRLLLEAVSLEVDKQVGYKTFRNLRNEYYVDYDDHWSPLVESVGNDLVKVLNHKARLPRLAITTQDVGF